MNKLSLFSDNKSNKKQPSIGLEDEYKRPGLKSSFGSPLGKSSLVTYLEKLNSHYLTFSLGREKRQKKSTSSLLTQNNRKLLHCK